MEQAQQSASVKNFLDLVKTSRKGKLKIYLGMSAGVGKTYRMLQEAHSMLHNGIHVQIGYIETHGRVETHALLSGIPIIPKREIYYKGKHLEEMDLNAILHVHPEVVLVDELAHSNVEGSKNAKRWQDVFDILAAGISVISALNVQHLESINEAVEQITGIAITERVPDSVLDAADEIVNIDLTADELIARLLAGKIYDKSKVSYALNNFFKREKILQLRELAVNEVSHHLQRKIQIEVAKNIKLRPEKFMACISTNFKTAKVIIRKTARLASYYHSPWIVLYVQKSGESADKIKLDLQRHLINNLKLATELGAEVIRIKNDDITSSIFQVSLEKEVTTICIGKPHITLFQVIMQTAVFNQLIKKLSTTDTDLIILS
jgi:two-component system sensor histidine kinase KdpD